MARPALVIFDCDGVLVDSEPIAMRVLLETLCEAGLTLDPALGYTRFLGRSLASTIAILDQEFGLALGPRHLDGMRERLYAAFRKDLRPVPGIAGVLAGLRLPFCVASSSQPERIRLSLELTRLSPYFEGRMFSATMVERGKPAPDLFLHAAAAMGAAPPDCLVIEDSPAGLVAAQAAGMRAVGFVGGGHAAAAGLRTTLGALNPDHILEEMDDLPDLLDAGPR
ncbi:HAD family hydrolase [Halodurantibacterium flavum]|uniref:HAD family hydrolase n=1 Tax=Halodurantibacterium flavum TaxID=1382802 RepID=A0ABW4S895_9RHOB